MIYIYIFTYTCTWQMTTINRWIHKWIHIYIHLYSIFTYIYKYFPRISFLTASLNFAGWTPVFFVVFSLKFEILYHPPWLVPGRARVVWCSMWIGGLKIPSEKRKLRWRRRCDAAKLMSFYLFYAWKKHHVWGDSPGGWQDGKIGGFFFGFLILYVLDIFWLWSMEIWSERSLR